MLATRPRAFAVFALCALGLAAAMGWVTHRALSLERAEARARAQAAQQEALRLALWRMDSTLSALLAQESGRPFFHYQSFYPADRPYDLPLDTLPAGDDAGAPSPLLAGSAVSTLPSALRIYFHLWPDGRLTSPQVPPDALYDRAAGHLESLGLSPATLQDARRNLDRLASLIDPPTLLAALAASRRSLTLQEPVPSPEQATRPAVADEGQDRVSAKEFEARRQVAQAAAQVWSQSLESLADRLSASMDASEGSSQARADMPGSPLSHAPPRTRAALGSLVPPGPEVGRFEPLWIARPDRSPQLLLVRSVRIASHESWQGLWLDWPTLRTHLLRQTADLLPGGDLVPDLPGRPAHAQLTQSLATIPALLVPGSIHADTLLLAFSPVRQAVAIGWIVVLLALASIGLVLREAVQLGERRGRFVSAVTHELRTPLTTFCLYSQMLADGMVADDDRPRYLRTLRDESARLARIVESVLDFARLGSRRSSTRPTPIRLDQLLHAALPPLADRAARAGMTLDLQPPPPLAVRADPNAFERILFNLVDNACKYAAQAPDSTIRIRADRDRRFASIRVSDHGPGIPLQDRPALFRPFQRGRTHVTGPTPGLGLGLALARSLAREMDGDLRLLPSKDPGATFELRLPLA